VVARCRVRQRHTVACDAASVQPVSAPDEIKDARDR
jgi:hypothetical protein